MVLPVQLLAPLVSSPFLPSVRTSEQSNPTTNRLRDRLRPKHASGDYGTPLGECLFSSPLHLKDSREGKAERQSAERTPRSHGRIVGNLGSAASVGEGCIGRGEAKRKPLQIDVP